MVQTTNKLLLLNCILFICLSRNPTYGQFDSNVETRRYNSVGQHTLNETPGDSNSNTNTHTNDHGNLNANSNTSNNGQLPFRRAHKPGVAGSRAYNGNCGNPTNYPPTTNSCNNPIGNGLTGINMYGLSQKFKGLLPKLAPLFKTLACLCGKIVVSLCNMIITQLGSCGIGGPLFGGSLFGGNLFGGGPGGFLGGGLGGLLTPTQPSHCTNPTHSSQCATTPSQTSHTAQCTTHTTQHTQATACSPTAQPTQCVHHETPPPNACECSANNPIGAPSYDNCNAGVIVSDSNNCGTINTAHGPSTGGRPGIVGRSNIGGGPNIGGRPSIGGGANTGSCNCGQQVNYSNNQDLNGGCNAGGAGINNLLGNLGGLNVNNIFNKFGGLSNKLGPIASKVGCFCGKVVAACCRKIIQKVQSATGCDSGCGSFLSGINIYGLAQKFKQLAVKLGPLLQKLFEFISRLFKSKGFLSGGGDSCHATTTASQCSATPTQSTCNNGGYMPNTGLTGINVKDIFGKKFKK